MCVCVCVYVQLCLTLRDPTNCACQAPLSMGFSRQEYRSGLPCPPPGDLPDPGIELVSPVSPASAGRLFITEPPGKPCWCHTKVNFLVLTSIPWLHKMVTLEKAGPAVCQSTL